MCLNCLCEACIYSFGALLKIMLLAGNMPLTTGIHSSVFSLTSHLMCIDVLVSKKEPLELQPQQQLQPVELNNATQLITKCT